VPAAARRCASSGCRRPQASTHRVRLAQPAQRVAHYYYYALGHFAKFVRPGAWRVASTELAGIQSVAFQNPDCSIVVVVYNANATEQPVNVVRAGLHFMYTVPSRSLMTFLWATHETCVAPPNDPA
jgi:O-glycosyl hydrolase